MLAELRIQNFAIIDRLELKFGPGLLIFTGETGAGKSIIMDAVMMLLGGRADATVVRTDSEMAQVEDGMAGWSGSIETLSGADGEESADVERTALATSALLRAQAYPELGAQGLAQVLHDASPLIAIDLDHRSQKLRVATMDGGHVRQGLDVFGEA